MRPVDALAERFVDELCALDPVTATEAGIPGHEDRLTDLSPEGFDAREALLRRTLAELRATDPVDEREQRARDAMLERLSVQADLHDAALVRSDFSVIHSRLHDLRGCFDLMDTTSEEGWRAVAARLRAVPAVLDGYRATLRSEAEAGRVAARRQYAETAVQVQQWTGQDGSQDLFSALVAPAPGGALGDDLRRAAPAACAAVAEFGSWLATEMVPRGRARDAVGRDHYTLASRSYLGATIDLEETYAWGWEELRRIEDEMAAIAEELHPGAGVPEAAAQLDADPTRFLEGTEHFRAWMQDRADDAVERLGGGHFDIPEPVRRIECRIAPTHDGGIYYTGPSEDFSRPGRMWWSVPAGITRFHPWREATTVYHEGVPGHHLQIGQTVHQRALLNRWQRHLCWVSGSGEGWALYAERLMDELGFLADPAERLGMLDGQALRAARVVVDIGLHLELEIPRDNPFGFHPGARWDADLVLEFMRAHARMDDEMIRSEVNRYLGWAGQAPAYKVGERLWLQARADAEDRHGRDFDLAAFHRAALELGSVGLDPLVAALERL